MPILEAGTGRGSIHNTTHCSGCQEQFMVNMNHPWWVFISCYCVGCLPGQFRCGTGECIAAEQVCDDIIDCEDGTDEGPQCQCELNSSTNCWCIWMTVNLTHCERVLQVKEFIRSCFIDHTDKTSSLLQLPLTFQSVVLVLAPPLAQASDKVWNRYRYFGGLRMGVWVLSS